MKMQMDLIINANSFFHKWERNCNPKFLIPEIINHQTVVLINFLDAIAGMIKRQNWLRINFTRFECFMQLFWHALNAHWLACYYIYLHPPPPYLGNCAHSTCLWITTRRAWIPIGECTLCACYNRAKVKRLTFKGEPIIILYFFSRYHAWLFLLTVLLWNSSCSRSVEW